MKSIHLLYTLFIICLFACQPTYEEMVLSEKTTVASLQEAYASKTYRVEDVVQAYLDRIAELDDKGPELNAVIVTNPEAIKIAKELDKEFRQGKSRGPLHGIPILLKDNISTKDSMATTAGSNALKGDLTFKDSSIAEQLRDAGAVILGKTNLSEWANFRGQNSSSGWSAIGGQTKNPYILERNPCGSSSGSGVAVSAGLAPIAIGTETNGSIVCPSHANGIVGIKPTVGLVSRTGIIPISFSQDTAGPMAKTVEDAVILLSQITGIDERDTKTTQDKSFEEDYTSFLNPQGLEGKRIGVWTAFAGINEEVDALFNQAVEDMKAQGAIIDTIDAIVPSEAFNTSFAVMLMEYEDGLNDYFENFSNSKIDRLQDVIAYNELDSVEMSFYKQEYLQMALEEKDTDSEEYAEALQKIEEEVRQKGMDAMFAERNLDAIIAPTGTPAWKTNWETGDQFSFGSSSPAAVSGYPNICVPMGFVGELPVGISIFGNEWQEAKLIEIAYAYEQATKHRQEPKFLEE